jgi:plastocyanin
VGKLAIFTLAVGVLATVLLLAAGDGAEAAHPVLDIHLHDNYYHVAGTFIVSGSTDHVAAKAACQKASPDAPCDAIINAGDSLRWIVDPPLATGNHTVTECVDGTFLVCANGASSGPIDDSGVRTQSGWPYQVTFTTPGTYYYHCDVHPNGMRGRVLVLAATGVGGSVDLAINQGGDGLATTYVIAAGALVVAALGGGALALRRRLARRAE